MCIKTKSYKPKKQTEPSQVTGSILLSVQGIETCDK